MATLLMLAGVAATATTSPKPKAPAPHAKAAAKKPAAALTDPEAAKLAARLAPDISTLEEQGVYGQAARKLEQLRALVPFDPDLDLDLALDLARAGERDSALALLYEPGLTATFADTLNHLQFQIYGWQHERVFFGGRFEGWYWYVPRARLELEAARGHWPEALAAARACVAARPLAGAEWYLLALCAAQTGAMDEARPAGERALRLAPSLPETHYLAGLLAWRDSRRAAAQQEFRSAVELDSTWRAPAVALVRSRLPVAPDPLPVTLLNGLREAALLTSSMQPKYDEFIQLETPARVTKRVDVVIPDSLSQRVKPMVVQVLTLFDTAGHAVFHQDPWAAATSAPDALVGLISNAVRQWEVSPAIRLGRPQALWLELDVNVVSATSQGE